MLQRKDAVLEMLQHNYALRKELIRSARPDELKSILELCLSMKEGNLKLPGKKFTSFYYNDTGKSKNFFD